ncbi:hypothetical protein N7508_003654 [Penicillium antarcticum]|uniref:uncharacterized protein n=1 Tax=Penicillium antarcticum TaxID=416450 RepID=UPI002398AC95|nr:uncharacterized protein N7508_003654 [Penicillium antarcticum]KAJ5312824.1 hypothetical protein N7508_003654 [Penicillium antarcticum]
MASQSPHDLVTVHKIQSSPTHPIAHTKKVKRSYPPIIPIIIVPTKDSPSSPIPDWFRLDSLPEELLEEVSKHLSVTDLKCLRLTSRHMYRISLREYAREGFRKITTDFTKQSLDRIYSILKDDVFRPQIREVTIQWAGIDRKAPKALVEAFWGAFNRCENCKISEACLLFLNLQTRIK